MKDISFGSAKVQDALRISILLKTVYIQTYAVDGITFEFTNFITERFSPERIMHTIEKNPKQLILAYKNDNPIGVAEVIIDSSCPIRKKTVPELGKLYVLTRFHGLGIADRLLKEAENCVLDNGFKEFYLEVYVKNERAIAFYKKQGYSSIGNVDFPMESNTYENLVMNKSFK